MRRFRVGWPLCALFILATLLVPEVVAAGLLGDTVGATLTNPTTSVNAFSATPTATVVTNPPPPIEFTGTFPAQGTQDTSTWGLDVRDNGFRLDGSCPPLSSFGCDFPDGLTLTLSDLDFTPPAILTGLTGATGSLVIDGNPVITSDSITITFESFTLVTGFNPATTFFDVFFEIEPVIIATPLPAALFLVLIGAVGLAIVGVRRILS